MLKSVYPKHKDRKYTFFIKKGVQIDKTPIFPKRFTDKKPDKEIMRKYRIEDWILTLILIQEETCKNHSITISRTPDMLKIPNEHNLRFL